MPDPLVTAAGISAAGSIAGGLLGSKSPEVDYRGAKKGIRWRVRDAKAAGIHPLYALGAPGIGSAVTSIPGQSPAARAVEGVTDAAASVFKNKARTADPLYQAQIRSADASANRDNAQATLALSEAARLNQGQPTSNLAPARVIPSNSQTGNLPSNRKLATSNTISQEEIEEQYGGFVGELYGMYRALHDYANRPNRAHTFKSATQNRPSSRGRNRSSARTYPYRGNRTYKPRGRGYGR